ncbi:MULTISPECIES: hypothetical protein [unclassified Bradyrhizobium]|uniref:hypothetical protein n=1 Tax=unclassified Bradyrhizobium TaxID=2631580 RepID=UPI0028E56EC4|nr:MULTISPECIES: hypothetical protein [unclassified Bradyrhizobium]
MYRAFALFFALGPLIGLIEPAEAAPAHHARARHHTVARPVPSGAIPGAIPPGWYKFPGYQPIPPEQNRNLAPSNFGGG